ncbi:MAG: hypothetical protein ACUVUD_07575, partial [bacterium]
MFCDVVIPRTPLDALTYEIPSGLELAAGDCVRVPLRGKQVVGVVFQIREKLGAGEERIQIHRVTDVLRPILIPNDMLLLIQWVADYYLAYRGEVMGFVLPRGYSLRKVAASAKIPRIDSFTQTEQNGREGFEVLVGSGGNERVRVAEFLRKTRERGSGLLLMPERRLKEWLNFVHEVWGKGVVEYHNGISPKIRRESWLKALESEHTLVVGVRGAVWVPFRNLSGVVILEEHFSGYKEERRPMWHARDVAITRAKFASCPVLLCDQSPTIETYANIKSHRYQLLSPLTFSVIRERIFVVDMRLHRKELLSPRLVVELKRALGKGKRAILFLNRKGVSRFVVCRQCGAVLKCPQCGVAGVLTAEGRIVCRYCGIDYPAPDECPSCHGVDFEYRAPGVDMVRRKLKEYGFSSSGTTIIVGTQKLLNDDFPDNLGIVGIVNLDTEFARPDFRVQERVFHLLSDVIARVQKQGARLVIQTYRPDELVIDRCLVGDVERFLKGELLLRKEVGFPPYRRLILLTITCRDSQSIGNQVEVVR